MKKSLFNIAAFAILIAAATQTASALPGGNVPDTTSSSLLLTIAFGGLMALRRFVRR
jgi:hypothetical protein